MKKFVLGLFVLTSLTLTTACSSDDDNGGGTTGEEVASITIDGNVLTFNTYDVQVFNNTRTISLSNSSNPNTVLTFALWEDETGGSSIVRGLSYFTNNIFYSYNSVGSIEGTGPQELTASIQLNSSTNFKAIVSGVLTRPNDGNFETVTLTNGNFDISY